MILPHTLSLSLSRSFGHDRRTCQRSTWRQPSGNRLWQRQKQKAHLLHDTPNQYPSSGGAHTSQTQRTPCSVSAAHPGLSDTFLGEPEKQGNTHTHTNIYTHTLKYACTKAHACVHKHKHSNSHTTPPAPVTAAHKDTKVSASTLGKEHYIERTLKNNCGPQTFPFPLHCSHIHGCHRAGIKEREETSEKCCWGFFHLVIASARNHDEFFLSWLLVTWWGFDRAWHVIWIAWMVWEGRRRRMLGTQKMFCEGGGGGLGRPVDGGRKLHDGTVRCLQRDTH